MYPFQESEKAIVKWINNFFKKEIGHKKRETVKQKTTLLDIYINQWLASTFTKVKMIFNVQAKWVRPQLVNRSNLPRKRLVPRLKLMTTKTDNANSYWLQKTPLSQAPSYVSKKKKEGKYSLHWIKWNNKKKLITYWKKNCKLWQNKHIKD